MQSGSAKTIWVVSTPDIVIMDHIVIADHNRPQLDPNLSTVHFLCRFCTMLVCFKFSVTCLYVQCSKVQLPAPAPRGVKGEQQDHLIR